MQIVINIDEEMYKEIKEDTEKFRSKGIAVPYLYTAIVNGTILPKGHGRLIDVDKFIDALFTYGQADDKFKLGEIIKYTPSEIWKIEEILAPTIIEAEKETEDE